MKQFLTAARRSLVRLKKRYLSESLDFRARIFNTLALVGIVVGITLALSAAFTNASVPNIALNLMSSVLAVVLLVFANRTGRFQLCFIIAVVALFFLMFPFMFFTAGGLRSGMPPFFVFAVGFTALMLQGRARYIATSLEILLYITICLVAVYFPETVTEFPTVRDEAQDILIGFVASSVALAVVISQHIAVYDRKQERLEHIDQAKTELIGNISHELKTPLTVISVSVQTVTDMLETMPDCERQRELLVNAQQEIMRLSRLVSGTLSLAAMTGDRERRVINPAELLGSSAEPWRLPLEKRGNSLQTYIAPDLPKIFGHADLLMQVISNILQNANVHTSDGEIYILAELRRGRVSVRISDNGSGIAPELLPRVFERGVSGGGGTGYGLYFCKTVVEAHGGTISISSTPGAGTTVTFEIPPYEGQAEGESL